MPSYRYKAIDGGGQFIAGELEAPGLQEALLRLKGLGYKPLETIAAGTGEKGQGFVSLSFRRSISRHQVTLFLAELALVLRAGLVLDEALQLLAGEERAALAAVARDIRSRIAGGASFADALAYHPPIFGPELVAMVRVAEASGTLDRVLASIAADRTKVERMLDKVSASLRYPAFLLVAATSVLIFFLVAVVPQFAGVIQDYNSAPGTLVSLVFGLSEGLIEYGYWIGCFVALTVLFVVLALRRPPLRRRMGAQFVRLPGLRGVLQLRRAVLFCSQLATLLSNGVTLSESLRVMLHMPGANVEGLDRVAEGVRRGGRLVEALAKTTYLPPLALEMLRVGEESGELALVTQRTAEFYEAKLSDRLDRIVGVIGPAAIIVIAALIGGLILSILSALLSVNQLVL